MGKGLNRMTSAYAAASGGELQSEIGTIPCLKGGGPAAGSFHILRFAGKNHYFIYHSSFIFRRSS
jgi:hypothetical protein